MKYVLKKYTRNGDVGKSSTDMDKFITIMSHEFKTPLTVINSAVQAMRLICQNELSEKSKGFLNIIQKNSNRQLKLVNNLLDITRISSGSLTLNKRDIDIVQLTRSISESTKIFAEQKGIRLSFVSTMKIKIIGVDEEKYERILLNLLSNAVKFTPGGKSIAVKVSQRIVKGKRMVSVRVEDDGIGIPSEMKELVFERFGQVDSSLSRHSEGAGIGLYLVKMLVELLDGEISMESTEGRGSTFTVLFPAAKAGETSCEQTEKKILAGNRLTQAVAVEFSDI